MTVWAWDGRGQDERRVWGAPSGPRNYRPLPACRAGPGTVHLEAVGRGRGSGTALAQTPACPPGSNPRGPEPGWGKGRLDVCARCQVRCTCAPAGRGLVGTELEKEGFLGTHACTDTKVGLFVHTNRKVRMEPTCVQTGVEVCVCAHTGTRLHGATREEHRAFCVQTPKHVDMRRACGSGQGQGRVWVTHAMRWALPAVPGQGSGHPGQRRAPGLEQRGKG